MALGHKRNFVLTEKVTTLNDKAAGPLVSLSADLMSQTLQTGGNICFTVQILVKHFNTGDSY